MMRHYLCATLLIIGQVVVPPIRRADALPPPGRPAFQKLLAVPVSAEPSVHLKVIFDAVVVDGAEQGATHRVGLIGVPGVDFRSVLREERLRLEEGRPGELDLCVHYAPWCRRGANLDNPCHKHREKRPTCRPVAAHDKDNGFQISIRGTIRIQFTIRGPTGFILGISGPTELRAPADALSGERKLEDYFNKFEFEEIHRPFGDTYYSLFATMVTHMFRGEGTDHGTTVPFSSSFQPKPHPLAMGKAVTVVEIGIARGGHSSSILKDIPQQTLLNKLYGVDPYLAGYDDEDIFAARKQHEFDAMHYWVGQRIIKEEASRTGAETRESSRFQQIRAGSADAAAQLKARGEQIHAVFVDGDHRANAVKTDLASWYPLLIPGGLMMGDDFHLQTVETGVYSWLATLPEAFRPEVHSVSKPGSENYRLFAFVKPFF